MNDLQYKFYHVYATNAVGTATLEYISKGLMKHRRSPFEYYRFSVNKEAYLIFIRFYFDETFFKNKNKINGLILKFNNREAQKMVEKYV